MRAMVASRAAQSTLTAGPLPAVAGHPPHSVSSPAADIPGAVTEPWGRATHACPWTIVFPAQHGLTGGVPVALHVSRLVDRARRAGHTEGVIDVLATAPSARHQARSMAMGGGGEIRTNPPAPTSGRQNRCRRACRRPYQRACGPALPVAAARVSPKAGSNGRANGGRDERANEQCGCRRAYSRAHRELKH